MTTADLILVTLLLGLLLSVPSVVLARSVLLGPQRAGRFTLYYKDLPGSFGLGFVTGPFMLVVHAGWWTWRLDWKGEFRKEWPHTRPIRKDEIPDGALYDFTKARGLNPHEKAAKRDRYHWKNQPKEGSSWLARLRMLFSKMVPGKK